MCHVYAEVEERWPECDYGLRKKVQREMRGVERCNKRGWETQSETDERGRKQAKGRRLKRGERARVSLFSVCQTREGGMMKNARKEDDARRTT